jgi:hypothetical protein
MNLLLLSISLLFTSFSLIMHFYQCLHVLEFSISVPAGLFSITIYRLMFPTNVSLGLCFTSVSLYGLVYPTVTPMASNENIKCYSPQLRSNNAHCYTKNVNKIMLLCSLCWMLRDLHFHLFNPLPNHNKEFNYLPRCNQGIKHKVFLH